MNRPFLAFVLVPIISFFGPTRGINAHAAGGYKIDLKPLYTKENGGVPESNICNYLEMTDGTILFFNPSIFKNLRALMDGNGGPYKANFLIFTLGDKNTKLAALTVNRTGHTLSFDAYKAKVSEIERTRLSLDWAAVQSFCNSPYKSGDPEFQKFGNAAKIAFPGITRLSEGRYMVSGGLVMDPSGSSASRLASRSAIIYDCESKSVVKTFKLCVERAHHLSLLLPDGKVILVGGMGGAGSATVELVDPNAGVSKLLPCSVKGWSSLTGYVDDIGNCFLLGGTIDCASTGQVAKINVASGTINKVGDLQIPRQFGGQTRNTIAIPSHGVLVSGGFSKKKFDPYVDTRTDAEVFFVDK